MNTTQHTEYRVLWMNENREWAWVDSIVYTNRSSAYAYITSAVGSGRDGGDYRVKARQVVTVTSDWRNDS